MISMKETSLSIPQVLFEQAETFTMQFNITLNQLFEQAIEAYINDYLQAEGDQPTNQKPRVINQGDIYWVTLEDVAGDEVAIPHPHVVIQEDVLNHSRIITVVTCALTSNLKRASLPGNILIEAGEGNLIKPSVAEASKISTVEKAHLGVYIGTLSAERVNQILAGMRFLQRSFDRD